jgi:hypothetical protein
VDAPVGRDDDPGAFGSEGLDPYAILRIGGETVSQMDDLIALGLEEGMLRAGEVW